MHKMFLSQQQKEMTMKLKSIAHSQEKTIFIYLFIYLFIFLFYF